MISLTRRDFLLAASAAPLALRPHEWPAKSCILLVLTGGPSHLDTWDMKPDAPAEIRGPFRPIRTNVPGIEICEIFPRMARHADKYALIRSVYSDSAPHLHEGGLQMIDAATTEFVTLPGPIGFMGGAVQPEVKPASGSFAENCTRARQLVESGSRLVRVNMFETVFHQATWDSHGSQPFSTIRDYRDSVGPTFDAAYSGLLEDLHQRGLLKTTLVVAMGEFGRTPRINPSGGRDHWTKCQTVVMAGGGIQGGQIYGSSDAIGAEPKEKPVAVERILSTIHHATGTKIGQDPIHELFT